MIKNVVTREIVVPIAIAEIVIYAGIFYSFPALLLQWEADLGWSKTTLSGAFSSALILSALFAPVVGRLIDRGLGQLVFTTCSIAAAFFIAGLAFVDQPWQFYLLWSGLGLAMAGTLYEPCFALLTRTMGGNAKRAITAVTLIAGFAGTLSFPLINTLADWLGWRYAMLVVAAVLIIIPPTFFWRAAGRAEQYSVHVRRLDSESQSNTKSTTSLFSSPVFWLLAISFSMIALNHGVLLTHILPLLDERGVHRETAVFAAAMVGPMQVAGRLAMMAAEKHISTLAVAGASFIVTGIAAVFLLGAHVAPFLLVGFVLFQGAGYGVTSITRPVVTAEFMGHRSYGQIAGLLATPYLLMVAAAPTLASIVWEFSNYDGVIALAFAAAIAGLLCLLAASKFAGPKNE